MGVHVAPVGLLLPFAAGFVPPRQLYTDTLFRVWGNLPYAPGDYATDGVLRMVYPGYQDSSYFHNERGFSTATPFGACQALLRQQWPWWGCTMCPHSHGRTCAPTGTMPVAGDGTDVLLSDAPLWVLHQYDTIIVSGEWLESSALQDVAETRSKLLEYAQAGGTLWLTAGAVEALGGFAGVHAFGIGAGACSLEPAGSQVKVQPPFGSGPSEVSAQHACTRMHSPSSPFPR